RMGRPAEAMELLDEIFADEPEDLGHWNLKAATLGRLGDFEEGIKIYEGVLAQAPNRPRVWVSYGHMLKTVGRPAEGINAYRKAIALQPAFGEAWWSLANLKTFKFDEDELLAMREALGAPGLTEPDRFHLDFALGKAMHDAGRTDEAFAHYSSANALRLKTHPYRPRSITKTVDR
ncbi:MAG TPA: tetratricopeptide repeat protein, partial [Sphingomicrobium sp.]|nr:tetratricopeptide repeat protein [Sphingomicrobium sp.]